MTASRLSATFTHKIKGVQIGPVTGEKIKKI
jgi:hypothetical protein